MIFLVFTVGEKARKIQDCWIGFHQWESTQKNKRGNRGQSIFPGREGRSWRGTVEKKYLTEAKQKPK